MPVLVFSLFNVLTNLSPWHLYLQANGGTKKAGGDVKAASPTLSASKIPALSPNNGKSSSVPAQCNDTLNSHNPSVKSHIPVTGSNTQSSRAINSSSLIRPAHNGTSKLQSPSYAGKGHHLSFSPQNANGRPSPASTASSSSAAASPSTSVSSTSLTQGMKSIRTIHTPSFTSYKSQNGIASKIATPKEAS